MGSAWPRAEEPACISLGRLVVEPDWRPLRHAHPFTELMVLYRGALTVEIGEAQVRAGPGDILHYPVEAPHLERVHGGRACDFIFLSFAGALPDRRLVRPDRHGRVRRLAEWMLEDRTRDGHVPPTLLGALLHEVLRPEPPAQDDLVARVEAHLREHLAQPLRVEELAQRVHLSRAHFIRTYRARTGTTPMAALRQLRVARARDLVIATDLPLRAIAQQVGLQDEHHLSHVFRRLLGAPPGAFRSLRPRAGG